MAHFRSRLHVCAQDCASAASTRKKKPREAEYMLRRGECKNYKKNIDKSRVVDDAGAAREWFGRREVLQVEVGRFA
jgi:hypothetical protein